MADGFGIGGYGFIEPWGSVEFPASATSETIGDFEFEVVARSVGFTNRIKFFAPATEAAPTWASRVKILRKRGEWPQSVDDSDAYVSVDDLFIFPAEYYYDEEGLIPGEIYYYTLYALRDDGVWIHDRFTDRDSAYPYDRWGLCRYMFDSMPRGWKSADADGEGHLESFMCIFGALSDNIKTDTEHLLKLFEIDSIHDDLIHLIDRKIAWPTWHATGGLQRRRETALAADLYRILGRAGAYRQMLEEVSGWDANLVEGWRYVLFSNHPASTTPDTSDPAVLAHKGRLEDVLNYTNDFNGWHSVNGLAFFLHEIPGVSEGLTEAMQLRFAELIEWAKVSYARTALRVVPITAEDLSLSRVTEEWFDPVWTTIESVSLPAEEVLTATTSSAAMSLSNTAGNITNDTGYRTFHEALEYV